LKEFFWSCLSHKRGQPDLGYGQFLICRKACELSFPEISGQQP